MQSRLTQSGNEEELRQWAWQRFRRHRNQHLTILTAHQVSQFSATGLGMDMAYMQQWRKLRAHSQNSINPREQFVMIYLNNSKMFKQMAITSS